MKLVRIPNITQYSNGLLLQEMTDGVDNITLPTAETRIESLQNAVDSLARNGYVQTYDCGLTRKDKLTVLSGGIARRNGAVYAPVNFHMIERVLKDRGRIVEVEHITDYLERILGNKVLPVHMLDRCAASGKFFDRYFSFALMKQSQWIRETAHRIQHREGYSETGRDLFCHKLRKAGLLAWTKKIFLTPRVKGNFNYTANLRKTLRLYIQDCSFTTLSEEWIYQDGQNDYLIERLERLGYERKSD